MVVVFILKFIQGISRTLLLASRTSFMEAIPAKMFGGAGPEHRSSPTPSVTCFGFAFNHGIQCEVGRCPRDQRVLYTAQSRNHEPTRVIIQPGSSNVKGHFEGTMDFFLFAYRPETFKNYLCGLDSVRVFPLFLLVSLLGCFTIQPSREATSLLKCFGKESHGSVWFEGRPKLDGLSVDLRW